MPRTRKSGDGGLYFDKQRKLWIGVVDNGFKANGSRDQRRVTSKSQTIARRKLETLKSEIASYGSPLGNKSVAEWGAIWLEGIKAKKPQTFRTYQSILVTWVLPEIGRKNVKDIRPSDLQRIYKKIRDAGRASSTALKAHNVMSSMFESARLERIVSINVANDVRPPKTTKSTRDTLAPDETLRLLQAAAGTPSGSKWLVSLYAGIRQGERLGATLDSVDLVRGLFTVKWNLVEGNYEHGCGGGCGKRAGGHCPNKRLIIPEGIDYRILKGRYMLVPPKSGEPRTFPLPATLLQEIERDVAELGPNPYNLLWPAFNGDPISGRADQAQWRALMVRASVDRPEATTHWARHTAISDMSAAGVSDTTIGATVGHKSPGVTGIYKHVSSLDQVDSMHKLEERRTP